jgi:hypothetical protein
MQAIQKTETADGTNSTSAPSLESTVRCSPVEPLLKIRGLALLKLGHVPGELYQACLSRAHPFFIRRKGKA